MESTQQATILLIEDEPQFRLIYRGVLENAGYRVIEAVDGQTGWDMVRAQKPDLVLLDLILPNMSGHEVLQHIRSEETTKRIPVIVFSVMGQEKDIRKSVELGANEHLLKGTGSPRKILDVIQTILKSKQ